LHKYVAFTELPRITEEVFLFREFSATTVYINSIDDFLIKLQSFESNITLIVSTNPSYWKTVLSKFKRNSIVFILIGNETYDPAVFNSLNGYKSIKHVFVYNLPTLIKYRNILGSVFGSINDTRFKKTINSGSIYRDARISYSLKDKFKETSIKYSASPFPQGYSNNFANQIANLTGINHDISLITDLSSELILAKRQDIYDFAFIGQSTNRRRETFLRNVTRFPKSVVIYNQGFKGTYEDSSSTYITQLLSARYVLVPPGFYNNFNHRYSESLICHTLPVVLANNSLDPSENTNWTNNLTFLQKYSAKELMIYLSKLDNQSYKKIYDLARYNDFKQISSVQKLFSEVLG
jgi:hypothetical protein